MSELAFASAVEQAARVRAREISPLELVDLYLERIERIDPLLNAFVTVCADEARAEAKRKESDPTDAPFHGVPIPVKDLHETAGIRTTYSSRAFADYVPARDAAVVRRLRDAGFVVLGKTNTPELGTIGVTESKLNGACRNPWDTTRTPGGSSGGAAAAVAAGLAPVAQGSDGGGSIRNPASCCGLFGIKPSRGRVSPAPYGPGVMGLGSSGPIARTVADAAALLDVMAGYEPGDSIRLDAPERPFTEAARAEPAHLRIAVAVEPPVDVPVDPACAEAARECASLLADLGHDVSEQSPDWDDEAFPSAWSTFVTGALQHIVRVLARLHDRPVDPELAEPATRAWLLDSPPVTLFDYLEAQERLIAFSRRILRSWPPEAVLVTPTLTRLPAPIEALRSRAGVTDDAVRFSALVRLWNVTGQPAISLPLHETGDGVPVGVQLVGPPGREDLLLALAAQLEASAGWAPQPPVPAERLKLSGTPSSA